MTRSSYDDTEGERSMLTYSLEERGDLPLYDYLSRRIKEDIWAEIGRAHV